MPAAFPVVVRENRRLGADCFLLDLEAESALEEAQPGQFLMLRGEWNRDPIGPRAMSVLDQPDRRCLLVLGRAVGRGTRLLAGARAGDVLACVGPLGKPFPVPRRDQHLILVAGGVGLPPLYFLARRCEREGHSVKMELLYGARSAADLAFRGELALLHLETQFATEDGTLGGKGLVTDLLAQRLADASESTVIYACGPVGMLQAVRRLALEAEVPAFLSLEGSMACGFGACLGCAVPARGSQPYRYCCADGPVFDARELAW